MLGFNVLWDKGISLQNILGSQTDDWATSGSPAGSESHLFSGELGLRGRIGEREDDGSV